MEGNCRESSFPGKTWHELAGKLAYFKKHGTNLQGSWLISKNLTRICKEAELFQKTWHEFARKLSYFKKHDTNLQGSWLISKNMTRICKEAELFQKTRQELAGKLAYGRRSAGITVFTAQRGKTGVFRRSEFRMEISCSLNSI